MAHVRAANRVTYADPYDTHFTLDPDRIRPCRNACEVHGRFTRGILIVLISSFVVIEVIDLCVATASLALAVVEAERHAFTSNAVKSRSFLWEARFEEGIIIR